ncbi:methyltransferase domain-containing protein [Allokutzneria sp. NRRL B-24872]|uniref:methyltransferase domain-containing protein n=1 Tax=Allokutzneria sp. NRRL B-24872 TaxID=1137961 RepID=UPI000A37011E|nr:methyltransferase domain-containing protein [Allokutzneria sp. NRRL B-24872]
MGLREDLVRALTDSGELSARWREAFLAVPRHAFLPDTIWYSDPLKRLSRNENPTEWLAAAYADDCVVTQLDDGTQDGPGLATSSASMPAVVATMLDLLDVEPGMRVCEIGTGTGYNAALLAYQLGPNNVMTVEVDPALARRARAALDAAGYGGVTVVCGDGLEGCPELAPFDRIIATANAQRIPYAWVEQTKPGGRIVCPWGTAFFSGALVSLSVDADGVARGGIAGRASFMDLRAQRVSPVDADADIYDEERATVTRTSLRTDDVIGSYDVNIAMAVLVPDCHALPTADGLWLIDPTSRSWAYAADGEVRQLGARRLWDEVEAAHRSWVDAGSTRATAWRFTVGPAGQRITPRR